MFVVIVMVVIAGLSSLDFVVVLGGRGLGRRCKTISSATILYLPLSLVVQSLSPPLPLLLLLLPLLPLPLNVNDDDDNDDN